MGKLYYITTKYIEAKSTHHKLNSITRQEYITQGL